MRCTRNGKQLSKNTLLTSESILIFKTCTSVAHTYLQYFHQKNRIQQIALTEEVCYYELLTVVFED